MERISKKVWPYKIVTLCDCGGEFLELVKRGKLDKEGPISAEYKCNKCGAVKTLEQKYWPTVLFRDEEKKLQRYRPVADYDEGGAFAVMTPDDGGEYVRYADVAGVQN